VQACAAGDRQVDAAVIGTVARDVRSADIGCGDTGADQQGWLGEREAELVLQPLASVMVTL
jgi:hypothetical protein